MITAEQMRKLEHDAVQQGISLLELMENAGKQVYLIIKEKFDLETENNKRIVIFCGQGNNGGDGFVIARYFAEDFPVIVLFFGDYDKLSEEARVNYDKINSNKENNVNKINIINIKTKKDLQLFKFQKDLEFVFIDALLGTGVKGNLREPISFGIDFFNDSLETAQQILKVAVDIPSGLDPDTGKADDKFCVSDLIVCFHEIKIGLEKFKDKTVVADIGIPKN